MPDLSSPSISLVARLRTLSWWRVWYWTRRLLTWREVSLEWRRQKLASYSFASHRQRLTYVCDSAHNIVPVFLKAGRNWRLHLPWMHFSDHNVTFCIIILPPPPKMQMENQVIVSDYSQMDRILREERQYILDICKKIKKAGCNVLLIQKSILR